MTAESQSVLGKRNKSFDLDISDHISHKRLRASGTALSSHFKDQKPEKQVKDEVHLQQDPENDSSPGEDDFRLDVDQDEECKD